MKTLIELYNVAGIISWIAAAFGIGCAIISAFYNVLRRDPDFDEENDLPMFWKR